MAFNSVDATKVFLILCSRRISAAENLRGDFFFFEDFFFEVLEDLLCVEVCAAKAAKESWLPPASTATMQKIRNRRKDTKINPENHRP
jgi:hypothetical protein